MSNAGLPTREVVTAAAMLDDDALLVLRDDAEPFGVLAPERLGDQIDPEMVALVSDEVGFVDSVTRRSHRTPTGGRPTGCSSS